MIERQGLGSIHERLTMTRWILLVVAVVALVAVGRLVAAVTGDVVKAPSSEKNADAKSPLAFTMKDIDGHDVNLADYKGKVVMIVNVASRCGFTPQYKGLEAIYEKYKDKGFVILGFPANNFKSQEPGSDADIKAFCTAKYNVSFPMFSKISVKGDDKALLYQFLTQSETAGDFGGEIGWNFTKFLIDRNGQLYARFGSATTPESAKVTDAIEQGLAK